MTKLSLCAIIKDEEKTLSACLDSARSIVDEIVVLDTGSTDNTPEVARSRGAKVYYFQWNDDFATARNEALKYTTGDWILVLDADERLTPEIIPILRDAIAVDNHLAINLVRQEIGAMQSPYSLVSRLFRNHPNLYFSRPYHATIDDSVSQILDREPHWNIIQLEAIAILHDGYRSQTIAAKNKRQRARSAMETFYRSHPDDAYVSSKLGALYVTEGNIEAGVRLLEKALTCQNLGENLHYELYYHLAIARTKQNRIADAIACYQNALKIDLPPRLKIGSYNNLGGLYESRGNFSAALSAYQTVLEIDPNFAIGYFNFGKTLKELGKFKQAAEAYQQAIDLDPEYAIAYQNLGVVQLKRARVREGLAAFQSAISLYDKQQSPKGDRLRQALQEMGFSPSQ